MNQPAGRTGRFIVFEGGEGSGKSTQAAALAGRLKAAGHAVTVTREPGGTPAGQRIRDIVLHSPPGTLPARAELLLFLADRAIHVEQVIRPALDRGDIVVCDRFSDSTVAYQGQGRGLAAKQVRFECGQAAGGLEPDLVFVLDIDPKVGLARAERRGEADRIEEEAALFHERVRLAFLQIADERNAKREAFPNLATDPRYVVLDATLPVDQLAAQVDEAVAELLTETPA